MIEQGFTQIDEQFLQNALQSGKYFTVIVVGYSAFGVPTKQELRLKAERFGDNIGWVKRKGAQKGHRAFVGQWVRSN